MIEFNTIVFPDRTRYFSVRYTDRDLAFANLSFTDMQFLKECDNSKSVADKLLALELIARKIEKHNL